MIYSGIACNKPVIPNGSVSPSNATVGFEETYEVTCDAGFELFDESFEIFSENFIMTCGAAGVFDQTPTCGK